MENSQTTLSTKTILLPYTAAPSTVLLKSLQKLLTSQSFEQMQEAFHGDGAQQSFRYGRDQMHMCIMPDNRVWHYNCLECSCKLLKVGSDSGLLWEESQLESAQSRQQSSITITEAFEGNETLILLRNPKLEKANILLLLGSF